MHSFFFVKNGVKYSKVLFSDILYVEAVNKYVRIITKTRKILIQAPISHIEKALPAEFFCRIHRSYLISLLYLNDFEVDVAHVANQSLPISRSYRDALSQRLLILKNLTGGEMPGPGDIQDSNDLSTDAEAA